MQGKIGLCYSLIGGRHLIAMIWHDLYEFAVCFRFQFFLASLLYMSAFEINKVSCPGKHYYEDLVDMMYDTVSESFNADFEDGSVEEVIVSSPSIFSKCH